MTEKFMGVYLSEDSVEAFKDIVRKERKTIKKVHKDLIEEYIKVHGDGNPTFTLDHFNDENFLATPAYHRPLHVWESYAKKCTDAEYRKWTIQLENLLNLEKKVTKQR